MGQCIGFVLRIELFLCKEMSAFNRHLNRFIYYADAEFIRFRFGSVDARDDRNEKVEASYSGDAGPVCL